jgi:hypothetical protein
MYVWYLSKDLLNYWPTCFFYRVHIRTYHHRVRGTVGPLWRKGANIVGDEPLKIRASTTTGQFVSQLDRQLPVGPEASLLNLNRETV